jgi:hypothetical protein
MGQKTLKTNRRALRRTAQKEKNNIVSRYMSENWDKVIMSAVTIIRQFPLKDRFSIARTILFKPIRAAKKAKIIKVDSGTVPVSAAPKAAPARAAQKAGA